ncbi:MAG: saccharopine dehydrogenase [Flammeovirgaceae bacterium]|nr:saccharopine dehydrogenase [Flammeovirgaceae bacterium]
MVAACLATRTHYTDITGEHQVFEMLSTYYQQAKDEAIQLMGGTGFDVVPSDCLALYLKNRLPSATHLQLAFISGGGFSRGTMKTMVEGLGYGSTIRKDGKLISIKTAQKVLDVDFGTFTSSVVCIPWGDISTAYRSTGIPNIEVYVGVKSKTIPWLKLSNAINPLLRLHFVKGYLKGRIEKKRPGPSEEKLKSARSFLWSKVWNDKEFEEARLETLSGYALTAKSSVLIAEKILNGDFKPGYQTPAMAYGEDLIMQIEGSIRT